LPTACSAFVDLGERTVSISHPGRGHTGHDLIAVVAGDVGACHRCRGRGCGVRAGHGAEVDSAFVYRQQGWLRKQM
jgi:hypothetical protein